VAAARFIGLTGEIASGKSEALAALARLGAAALSSDAVVHDLLTSERVRDLLVGRWGPTVAPNGKVDRGRVSEVVFADPSELDWLEATLHPLVAEEIAAWRESLADDTGVAVVEVPLLFETDMEGVFDATISVVAPDGTRAERAGVRGTLDLESRSRRQLSQEEKAARATYVVINDGSVQDLEAALAELLAEIESKA
jgi:dephospho-CoA kinase